MDGMFPGNVSDSESNASSVSSNILDDEVVLWYFSREEIENNSPSRRDGIDLKKETRLRKSYCTFLEDLGVRLKFPQITIATAIAFCHRFFLRQSHAKNDRWTIATICMLLAGKVEETPRPLEDFIIVSYEIIHKKDLATAQRKEVYEQQKELVLSGEELVLATLNFDLSVRHPYKPLVEAIMKYMGEKAKDQFAQMAWNLVNDCLLTSLCLQYKPHHIAAGAFSLAAEHLTMDLQSYGVVLCQEFDVTPRQLEDIRGQMLASQRSIVESNPHGDLVHQPFSRDMASTDTCPNSDIEGGSSKVNISQSDEHSVNDRFRPEGIEKETSESEAEENRDADDVGVSQLEKDLQLRPEELKAKGEKDKKSFDKGIKKRDLMDEIEREVEDVELCDEDHKAMQRISQRLLIVRDSDNSTSIDNSEILDANHSGED